MLYISIILDQVKSFFFQILLVAYPSNFQLNNQ